MAAMVCGIRIFVRWKHKRKVRGTYVVVRTTLASGEDSLVNALLKVLSLFDVLPEEDQTSTGTTESLVATRSSVSTSSSETRENS